MPNGSYKYWILGQPEILYISLHPLNPFFAPLLIISCPSNEKPLKPAECEKENFHLKNKRATRLSKVMPRWVSTIPLIVFDTVLCHAWRLESQSSWVKKLKATSEIFVALGDSFEKKSKEHPRPFCNGGPPFGSETSAFVSVLTHSSVGIRQKSVCTIIWFKKRTTLGLTYGLDSSRYLACHTMLSVNAWRARIMHVLLYLRVP